MESSCEDQHQGSSCSQFVDLVIRRPQHQQHQQHQQQQQQHTGLCLSAYRRPADRLVDPDTSRKISEFYDVHSRVLGHGGTSTVKLACRKRDGLKVAVKLIQKHQILGSRRLSRNKRKYIDEWEILRMLQGRNDHVASLVDVFETDDEIHLVLEYCEGGELFDFIHQRRCNPFHQKLACSHNEIEAASVARQILSVLKDLHELDVVHRDVKPENILLERPQSLEVVKLCDFGIARVLTTKNKEDLGIDIDIDDGSSSPVSPPPFRSRAYSMDGSDFYMAPEVLEGQTYGPVADVYSLGVTLYVLLCGTTPSSRKANPSDSLFLEPNWKNVSNEGKDLVSKMLERDPKKRITAAEALQDEWLSGNYCQFQHCNRKRNSTTTTTCFGRTELGITQKAYEPFPPNKRRRVLVQETPLLAMLDICLNKARSDKIAQVGGILDAEEHESDDEEAGDAVGSCNGSTFTAISA